MSSLNNAEMLDSESVDDPSVIPESEELELSNPISKDIDDSTTVIPETEELLQDSETLPEPMEDAEGLTEETGELTEETEELTEEPEEFTEETEELTELMEEIEESTKDLPESVLSDKTNTLNNSQSSEGGGAKETQAKLFRFPLGTVKKIVKMDDDVHMASQDAILVISKATELFVASLAAEAFSYTSKNKKKTIQKNDVVTAIETTEALAFLDGAMDD